MTTSSLKSPPRVNNLIAGEWLPSTAHEVTQTFCPHDGRPLATVPESTLAEVQRATLEAHKASHSWRMVPIKERCLRLFKLRELLVSHTDSLADLASRESGKTREEARQGLLKGIEVVEFATALQNSDAGFSMEVSRGVSCASRREPLGVVVGITPFNFPAMVPLWMYPVALAVGNSFILKPSEKVALTSQAIGQLIIEAGFPPGVFSIINGGRSVAQALMVDPKVRAVAFVGSTPAARSVYQQVTHLGKKALCLGGAKNHLILLPDSDPAVAVPGIVGSFTGCAGQRCMAGSVLIAVGKRTSSIEADPLEAIIRQVVAQAGGMTCGPTHDMGGIIDRAALDRIHKHIEKAVDQGGSLVLDGRNPKVPSSLSDGFWLGPTVIDSARPDMECARVEIFGPVLTILRVDTLSEALAIEALSPYGNATSVFTNSGAAAKHVCDYATAGMIGINVGVPVPREPFSFGGTKDSKFGHGDITGPSSLEFWTQLKKITTKWSLQTDQTWMG